MITILYSLLLASVSSLAAPKVKTINTIDKLITTEVEGANSIKSGQYYSIHFSGDTQCTLEVKNISRNKAFLSASTCDVTKVKIGQELKKLESYKGQLRKKETWFTSLHLGSALVYPGSSIKDQYTKNTSSLGVEMLAFHWPFLKPGLTLGFILGSTYRYEEDNSKGFTSLYSYGAYISSRYFFEKEIGHGWFTRLDLGYKSHDFFFSPEDLSQPIQDTVTNSFSYRVGGGWSIHAWGKSHLIFDLLWTNEIKASALQGFVGVLW